MTNGTPKQDTQEFGIITLVGGVVRNSTLEVPAFSHNFVHTVANSNISWENCRTPCSQTNQAIQSYIKTRILSSDGKMSVPQKP